MTPPPVHFGKYALFHRILCRGIRRNAERISILRFRSRGLIRPTRGRGIPDTPPPPTWGGMIDFKRKVGRGYTADTPHHDRDVSTHEYP